MEIGNRIIGGYSADIKDFPFITALIEKLHSPHHSEKFRGAAVIVTRNIAITAGHCVYVIPVSTNSPHVQTHVCTLIGIF